MTADNDRRLDAACVEMATKQYGVISRAQALGAGLGRMSIQRRVDRGQWRQIHDGVYAIGAAVVTWRLELMAACLAGGPQAVVSHRAAAVLWALDGLVRAPVEITVPHGQEALARRVVTHRSRKLDHHDVTSVGGIPATNLPRTLVDLGRFESEAVVEKALESALRRRLITEAACSDYLVNRAGRIPGASNLRRVLRARAPGAAAGSPLEVSFLRLLRDAGVPTPVRQYPVELPGGAVVYLDFAWPWKKVATEIDGYAFHGGRLAHAADLERQNALVALGWTFLRFTGLHLRNPDRVVSEVLARLAA